ncbi:hypothetical protein C8Q77DRAFT_26760 [Trametes polyzona]|nr:hypothetical protein C8Q77DRAFT_26760 [Trametes polyzona]
MAASPVPATNGEEQASPQHNNSKWNADPMDVEPAREHMGPGGDIDTNGASMNTDDRDRDRGPTSQEPAEYPAPASVAGSTDNAVARTDAAQRGEKLIKPNKVYIGGLPEHTRKEDLESCFGKIGNIVNIELKYVPHQFFPLDVTLTARAVHRANRVGYGFVEFDNREAAEESVAKYHEGYFMGNKIRVEISHGGGRTAKYSGDPGACFKCGQMGHWARECPNHLATGRRPGTDAPLIDRIQPPREYLPPPRDYYRDYPGYLPPRDPRYYDYPPPPIGRDGRYGRPPSPPPRDVRDYPPPPVAVRSTRDYDDYRMRGPPPPPSRYESRAYYPEGEPVPPGYPPRGYPPPPPRDYYDRYDRRAPPAADRYSSYPPAAVRPRTPPGAPPPRSRDDYDRPPARDYPPATETRGRPVSPPPARYADYPARSGSAEGTRYRRRSQSPPSRSASGAPYESTRYESGSGGAAYNGGTSSSYAGNGYASTNGGAPTSARSSGGTRDYAPPRAAREPEPASSYRRT